MDAQFLFLMLHFLFLYQCISVEKKKKDGIQILIDANQFCSLKLIGPRLAIILSWCSHYQFKQLQITSSIVKQTDI